MNTLDEYVGITGCVWLVREYTATSGGVVVAPSYRSSACSADSSRCFCAGASVHVTSSPVSPAGCVTGPGHIDCAYQNHIPPVLPMLSWGEAIDRSLSFAKRVLSTLWPDLSVRVAEWKTDASKNRLATRTNRQTRSRAVIVVICLMVQFFIGYACRAHPISRQHLCRFIRKRLNDLDIRVFAGFLGCWWSGKGADCRRFATVEQGYRAIHWNLMESFVVIRLRPGRTVSLRRRGM